MKAGKLIARGALALLALPLLYLLGALIGAIIPAGGGAPAPRDGVTIFVRTNDVHTWLMVPTVAAGVDWRPLVPARDLADPNRAGDYLAFGWGSRAFYLNTPSWRDLTLRTAAGALFGNGPALMHVDHERSPRASADERPLRLSIGQYHALARYIRGSFAPGANGRAVPLHGRGYSPSDAFYEARGRYNMLRTSNEWSGAGLRAAGVKVGVWTPFAQSLMWRFEAPPSAD